MRSAKSASSRVHPSDREKSRVLAGSARQDEKVSQATREVVVGVKGGGSGGGEEVDVDVGGRGGVSWNEALLRDPRSSPSPRNVPQPVPSLYRPPLASPSPARDRENEAGVRTERIDSVDNRHGCAHCASSSVCATIREDMHTSRHCFPCEMCTKRQGARLMSTDTTSVLYCESSVRELLV